MGGLRAATGGHYRDYPVLLQNPYKLPELFRVNYGFSRILALLVNYMSVLGPRLKCLFMSTQK